MIIGTVREKKSQEDRVGLAPESANGLGEEWKSPESVLGLTGDAK